MFSINGYDCLNKHRNEVHILNVNRVFELNMNTCL